MREAVSIDEAWDLFVGVMKPVGSEFVEIRRSLGRILAEDIICSSDFPPKDIVLKDGYALRVQDLITGRALQVVGGIRAGETWEGKLASGDALRVMTGVTLPMGADAVLPLEHAQEVREGFIRGPKALPQGTHVGLRGSAARAGEKLVFKGKRLGCNELATIASIGYASVEVSRRPRVGILPTGSELVRPGESKREAEIYSSHALYLDILVRKEGGHSVIDGPIPDESLVLQEAIWRNRETQLLITIGGTGMGEGDLIFQAMRQLRARVVFRGIRMRPGQGISLHLVEGCPVLSLPGGFGAVRVGFEVLARPALQYFQGEKLQSKRVLECVVEDDLARDPNVYRFVEAEVWEGAGLLHAAPVHRGPVSWGVIKHFGEGWIRVPPGRGDIERGSRVSVLWRGSGLTSEEKERPSK